MRTTAIKEASKKPSHAEDEGVALSNRILDVTLDSLETAKAEDIVPLDIRGKSALADHMVIASGRSNRHVGAVCDQLLRALKDNGFSTSRVEGLETADWVLIDAGDVIIHIFRPEVREFYALEKMWSEPDQSGETLH